MQLNEAELARVWERLTAAAVEATGRAPLLSESAARIAVEPPRLGRLRDFPDAGERISQLETTAAVVARFEGALQATAIVACAAEGAAELVRTCRNLARGASAAETKPAAEAAEWREAYQVFGEVLLESNLRFLLRGLDGEVYHAPAKCALQPLAAVALSTHAPFDTALLYNDFTVEARGARLSGAFYLMLEPKQLDLFRMLLAGAATR